MVHSFNQNVGLMVFGLMSLALSACAPTQVEATPTESPATNTPTTEVAHPTNSPTHTADAFPTPQLCEAGVVEQPFEHGRMFWVGSSAEERCKTEHTFVPGSGEIWVAIFNSDESGGEWFTFPDSWLDGTDPELDASLTPPADKLQPIRGFGKVWRESLNEDQRRAIGWALGLELAHTSDYRYEAGGIINADGVYVPRPGQHIVMSLVGEQFVFDEQTGTFEYTPAE